MAAADHDDVILPVHGAAPNANVPRGTEIRSLADAEATEQGVEHILDAGSSRDPV